MVWVHGCLLPQCGRLVGSRSDTVHVHMIQEGLKGMIKQIPFSSLLKHAYEYEEDWRQKTCH